jgi:Flp pilus assembly protein TadB
MRGVFSMVGLLVVLAIVGLLAKHQLSSTAARKAATASSSPVGDALGGKAPQVENAQQAQQLQKQVQDDMNRLMQSRATDLEQQQPQPQAEPKP